MKKIVMIIMVILGVMAYVGAASAFNLLQNGSFESGLTGWSTSGSYLTYPVSVIVTDGTTGSAFGEAIPADTIIGGSPDSAGSHAAYFVDDIANQVLSQSIYLTAGSYEIGFDTYVPLNGYKNKFTATFSGAIANIVLADFDVKLDSTPKTWVHYSGLANVLVAGSYEVAFNFETLGAPAADVVVDRVYIVGSDSKGGTPISTPEPATMLLLGLGLLGLAGVRRKIK